MKMQRQWRLSGTDELTVETRKAVSAGDAASTAGWREAKEWREEAGLSVISDVESALALVALPLGSGTCCRTWSLLALQAGPPQVHPSGPDPG